MMTRTMCTVTAIVAVIGCAPAQSNSGTGASASVKADTLVGVVTEVGADPATWMSIRPTAGGQSLRLSGDAAATLRAVGNTEIWVSGARQVDGFRVDAFEVRKANGVAVDDGTVSLDGGKVRLTTRGGTREVPNAPAELTRMAGTRVWITRPIANETPTYGVIKRP
jgi:hypothetical protein